jgi:hypothetical protein
MRCIKKRGSLESEPGGPVVTTPVVYRGTGGGYAASPSGFYHLQPMDKCFCENCMPPFTGIQHVRLHQIGVRYSLFLNDTIPACMHRHHFTAKISAHIADDLVIEARRLHEIAACKRLRGRHDNDRVAACPCAPHHPHQIFLKLRFVDAAECIIDAEMDNQQPGAEGRNILLK